MRRLSTGVWWRRVRFVGVPYMEFTCLLGGHYLEDLGLASKDDVPGLSYQWRPRGG